MKSLLFFLISLTFISCPDPDKDEDDGIVKPFGALFFQGKEGSTLGPVQRFDFSDYSTVNVLSTGASPCVLSDGSIIYYDNQGVKISNSNGQNYELILAKSSAMNDWNGHVTNLDVDEVNQRIAILNNYLYQINIIDFEGNLLYTFSPENAFNEHYLECNFAPDGDLYYVYKEGINHYIYFYDFEAEETYIFGENLINPRYPAISNDGMNVAFILNDDLWISDLNGENAEQITTDGMFHRSPVWSPDGKWIATVNTVGIHVLNIENGNYLQIKEREPDLFPNFKGINGYENDYKISWKDF